jgi:uncharacterized coiled-coil DUF342 family protein
LDCDAQRRIDILLRFGDDRDYPPLRTRRNGLAIQIESLKSEREELKAALRELENEQRKLESSQKKLRQREIQTKRTIEALDTLIEVQEPTPEDGAPSP